MTFFILIRQELFERKQQLMTSFLTILLGVAAIVSINSITSSSQTAIRKELERLGANVLILPKDATVQNYYTADIESGELPEAYVAKLSNSGIHGMDNLSPKLSTKFEAEGQSFILTGILPKNEIRSKALWQGSDLFAPAALSTEICPTVDLQSKATGDKLLTTKRMVDKLEKDQVFVGSETASILDITQGSTLNIKGTDFVVAAVLPPSGTVDDSRVFAHLHTVQALLDKPGKINVVEVIGCCQKIFEGLVPKINALLPDAKVVTIGHVVETQLKTNQMMEKISWIFLVLIILVGGAGIANFMYANVNARKKEIGTLMALGAGSKFVLKLFFGKALILGFTGGIGGYVTGTILAMTLGPYIAHIPVYPSIGLLGMAILISVSIAFLASFLPARKAALVDPCIAFREV